MLSNKILSNQCKNDVESRVRKEQPNNSDIAEIVAIQNILPIKTIEAFNNFNQKLKSHEVFKNKIVSYIFHTVLAKFKRASRVLFCF